MKKILYLIIPITLLFIACQKEELSNEAYTIQSDVELDWPYAPGEPVTLDQLNKYLAKHNISPRTQSRMDEIEKLIEESNSSKPYKTNYSCSHANVGDWSRQLNKTNCNYVQTNVTGADLVLANNYIQEFQSPSQPGFATIGEPFNNYPACASDNFGTISFFESNVHETTVDTIDMDIVSYYVLNCQQ